MGFDSGLNNLRLLTTEQILQRLARMHGERYIRRPDEVTRNDLARWLGLTFSQMRQHERGQTKIGEGLQIAYSQFFELLDSGQLAIRMEGRKKVLVRVPAPACPPKKPVRPHVEFSAAGPKLRFDHS